MERYKKIQPFLYKNIIEEKVLLELLFKGKVQQKENMGNQIMYRNNYQGYDDDQQEYTVWERIKNFVHCNQATNQNVVYDDVELFISKSNPPLLTKIYPSSKAQHPQNSSNSFTQTFWQKIRPTIIYKYIQGWDTKSSKNYIAISEIIFSKYNSQSSMINHLSQYQLLDSVMKQVSSQVFTKTQLIRIQNEFIKKQVEQKKIQCPICIVGIGSSNDMSVLEECGHVYHKKCIQELVKVEVNEGKIKILCPQEDCRCELSLVDIHNHSSQQILQKYYKFTFNAYIEAQKSTTAWCPTPGCHVVIQFQQNMDKFQCRNCKKVYCLKCKEPFHLNFTCQEYKKQMQRQKSYSDNDFIEDVTKLNFKQCPHCNYWVQKVQGCNIITCKCKKQFCYGCRGTGCSHSGCKMK